MSRFWLILASVPYLFAVSADPVEAARRPYNGHLEYLLCDIKKPLAGQMPLYPINQKNYRAILSGLVNELGCNGIRVYIDPSVSRPQDYPEIYKEVFRFARKDLGLLIYANPLGTGTFGLSEEQFAHWVADYANYFRPDFLAPFNESGLPVRNTVNIVQIVRKSLAYDPAAIVGPDQQKILSSIGAIQSDRSLPHAFDVFGSHNAAGDFGATHGNWKLLAELGGQVWATENPRPWSQLNASGQDVGVDAVLDSPVTGLVLYLAYPCSIDSEGNLTLKGNGLMSGILSSPRMNNLNPTPTPIAVCGQ